ncbi:MAG TPA: N-acetylmuramoyl-L-alanine amidase [Deltaproteobacteria bacterium]|nr:N-acetylmuramoyl-L-alanine amidase [Deltaproteobacteria bacterium]
MDYFSHKVMDYITQRIKLGFCIVLSVLLCVTTSSAGHASVSAASAFQSANKAYIELSRDIQKRKQRTNWIDVIELYLKLPQAYTETHFAPRALYRAAKLYEELYGYSSRENDLKKAIEIYLNIPRQYPSSSLADDALFRSAGIYNNNLGNTQKAYALYRQVITDFPDGDMVQHAREELNALTLEKRAPLTLSSLSLVKDVRQWSDREYTRVVIDLEKDVSFKTFALPPNKDAERSHRVVIDLINARTSPAFPYKFDVNDGILSNVRVSQYDRSSVRVVMDLTQKSTYNAFPLQNPPRLVIDIKRDGTSPAPVMTASRANTPKKVPIHTRSSIPDNVPSVASQLSLKVSRIVIDPGHGGKDPGAISPTGIKEKGITLELGKLLAQRLKKDGFQVFLTREKDVFMTLEERTAFANQKKADLFISLHLNANSDRSVRGIETYFLNLTTDASAIEVAARENATSTKSISDLQLIINDLMLNSKINESSRFAGSVHKSVLSSVYERGYRGKDLGVRQAPFYVLLGAQMPSILLELGFITNVTDSTLLTRSTYQNLLVDGIAKGIQKYIMSTSYAYYGSNQ